MHKLPKLLQHIKCGVDYNDQIESDGLSGKFRILVSNNCSSDDTGEVLDRLRNDLPIELKIFDQTQNIGLEKNAIFLLFMSNKIFFARNRLFF